MLFRSIHTRELILIFVFLPKELQKESGNSALMSMLEASQCQKPKSGIKSFKQQMKSSERTEKEFWVLLNIISRRKNILKITSSTLKRKISNSSSNVSSEFFHSLILQEMLSHTQFSNVDLQESRLSWLPEINQLQLPQLQSNAIS